MKKFLLPLLMLFAIAMTSCKSVQFGLAYDVSISGDGDGQFEVSFPQGSYAMDGTATLALIVGDTLKFGAQEVSYKADILKSGDAKKIAAMKAVNDSIAYQFNATAGSGTYDIWIRGMVKELATGLSFSVNRHLTNRDNRLYKAPAVDGDAYPFIE